MGRVNCNRITFIATISEIVGYKSGIALSRDEMSSHLPDYNDYWLGENEDGMSIRFEEYQEIVGRMLFELGNIPVPAPFFPGIAMFHKYKNDKKKLEVLINILELFNKMGNDIVKSGFDYDAFALGLSRLNNPILAVELAKEFFDEFNLYQHVSPLTLFRQIDWKDELELKRLFNAETINYNHGNFFDQRFIDYLNKNFSSLDKINWRQFEALVAEYFDKRGYFVKIGTGRNDENIDVRIWKDQAEAEEPPTIIVQCKRQKEKVEKVVVKALYSDLQFEKARVGLIVTSHSLSPGAIATRNARSYPIIEVNRDTLKKWINKMRSPNTGVFLAT